MSLVSVIMPSYNVKKYIEECMESVCNQTLQDIEILAIDAGSEDGTLEILRNYAQKDSRVKVIISEQKSYGYQVNKGISMALGEYIAIVETDDVAESNMLENLYVQAKEHDLDYVKGDYAELVAFEDGTVWKRNMRPYPRTKELYYKVLTPKEDVHTFLQDVFLWRGIYKRDFLLKYNIVLNETKGAALQDQGFLFQTIALARRAMYIPDVVYNYRKNNMGSSVYNTKAFGYLLGEYPFVRQQLEALKQFNDEMKACYYVRMFTQIRERYRTMAVSGMLWDNTQEERRALREIIESAYKEQYLDEILLGKALWLELQQYLENEEEYWRHHLQEFNAKRKYIMELIERAKGAESIVFYSRSIIGGFIYCMLKTFGIQKPVCFCDNDREKQGTFYMGIPVLSVEEAVVNNPNALYIIANRKVGTNMRQQLCDCGVKRDKITVWMLDVDMLFLQCRKEE